MRTAFRRYTEIFLRDSYIHWPILGAILLSVIGVLLYFVYRSALPSVVPLFYSLPWGEERLAKTEYLLVLPVGTIFVVLVNGTVGLWTYSREQVLSRMVALGTLLFALLALTTMARIIWIIV